MKVLLLQPPVQDFYHTDLRLQPLGLGYLKAAVSRRLPAVRVVVKDYHQGYGRTTLRLPRELSHLREFYAHPDRSPFSTFHQYYHFGAPFEALALDVARERPDLVGISSLFTAYHREVVLCAEAIRRKWDAPILVGGSHVSAQPLLMLAEPCIDFVIRGEGERPLVELLQALLSGGPLEEAPNLGFKRGPRLTLNPLEANFPLDQIPPPDLSDLPLDNYTVDRLPMAMVITSRSCPHACQFCVVHTTFGTNHRRRPWREVIDELKLRRAEGRRVFDFEDDGLGDDRDYLSSLCEGIAATFPPGDVRCCAMNGIGFHNLDQGLLRLMRQAGFSQLNLSLVSADPDLCRGLRRPGTLRRYLEVVRDASALGFRIISYQILGLPGDDLESIVDSLTFQAGLPVLLGASPFYLLPTAGLARQFGPLSRERLIQARLTALGVETEDFDRRDIYTLLVATRIINFLKSFRPTRPETDLQEALEMARHRDKRSRLGVDLLNRLLQERRLYCAGPNGLNPQPAFKDALFSKVWSRLPAVVTQTGQTIHVGPNVRHLAG